MMGQNPHQQPREGHRALCGKALWGEVSLRGSLLMLSCLGQTGIWGETDKMLLLLSYVATLVFELYWVSAIPSWHSRAFPELFLSVRRCFSGGDECWDLLTLHLVTSQISLSPFWHFLCYFILLVSSLTFCVYFGVFLIMFFFFP